MSVAGACQKSPGFPSGRRSFAAVRPNPVRRGRFSQRRVCRHRGHFRRPSQLGFQAERCIILLKLLVPELERRRRIVPPLQEMVGTERGEDIDWLDWREGLALCLQAFPGTDTVR